MHSRCCVPLYYSPAKDFETILEQNHRAVSYILCRQLDQLLFAPFDAWTRKCSNDMTPEVSFAITSEGKLDVPLVRARACLMFPVSSLRARGRVNNGACHD